MVFQPLVLRAELECNGDRVLAHTTAVARGSVLVRTDAPLVSGSELRVKLSFGRLLAPLELSARVVAATPGAGHGYGPGVTIDLREPGPRAAGLIARLVGDATPWPTDCRVLVVEDSEIMRECVIAAAERFDASTTRIHVEAADTAEAALQLLAQRTYDLALVDLYLVGGMSGAELVRRSRAGLATDLPVVGFSIGGAAARTAFLDAGADLFLEKPVMIRDLLWTGARLVGIHAQEARMKRILLMDDSPIFLELAAIALRDAGFDVVCANDLAQLKELREQVSSDLVLMDVQMPEAFGDDIALTLRHVYGVDAPIYLLSSLDDAELAARVKWAEIEGFISKNLGLETIVREVRRILAAPRPEA